MTYGCHNRLPIVTFGATACQYTLSKLGQADKKCEGCKEQNDGHISLIKAPLTMKFKRPKSYLQALKQWGDTA
jgi:hypothetical protein